MSTEYTSPSAQVLFVQITTYGLMLQADGGRAGDDETVLAAAAAVEEFEMIRKASRDKQSEAMSEAARAINLLAARVLEREVERRKGPEAAAIARRLMSAQESNNGQ